MVPACSSYGQETDKRIEIIRDFLLAKRSPLSIHADAFVTAADKYGLDWRLLPSLALVETGGRARKNNNVFGWGNGRIRFVSIQASIDIIADRLSNGASYRNKTIEGKLRTYNPANRRYAARVLDLMTLIGPVGAQAAVAVTAAALESTTVASDPPPQIH